MSNINVGDDVKVISGDHEGRGGRVTYVREVGLDNREPEHYALVEFASQNANDEWFTDSISVPVRRLARK